MEKSRDFSKIVVVSVGAGKNDILVPNYYTSSNFADVDATTLGVSDFSKWGQKTVYFDFISGFYLT